MQRTLLARQGSDIVRQVEKGRLRPFRGQSGFTLIEVVVAVAILAAIGVTFIGAIDTGYGSVQILDEKTQAEALIRSQLDDNCSTVEEIVGDNVTTIQEITVTVFRTGGEGDRPVFSVACYKSKVE